MSTPASTWRRPRPRPRWSGFPWPRCRSRAWRWAAGSSLHSGTAMSGHDELVVARAADRGRASGNRKHPARPVALNLWERGRLFVLTGSGRGLTPETTNRLVCPSPATQRHPSITICGLLWVGTDPRRSRPTSLRRSRSLGMRGIALSASLLLTAAVLLAGAVLPAGAASTSLPGQLIDLSRWSLTLPVAAPGRVKALTVGPAALPAYSLLRANTSGAAVLGGALARSELREVSASGSAAAWTSATSNNLTTRRAITHLPAAEPVSVTAQVRAGSTNLLADPGRWPRPTEWYCHALRPVSWRPAGVLPGQQPCPGCGLRPVDQCLRRHDHGVVQQVVKLTLAYTGTGMSFRVGAYLQTNKGTDATPTVRPPSTAWWSPT